MRSWSSQSKSATAATMKGTSSAGDAPSAGSSFRSSEPELSSEDVELKFAARVEKALKHDALPLDVAAVDRPLSSKLLKLNDVPFVGREREMEELNGALDRLLRMNDSSSSSSSDSDDSDDEEGDVRRRAAQRQRERPPPKVLSISGAPGSGKSCLAQQLQGRVQQAGGYFLRGKFDATSSSFAANTADSDGARGDNHKNDNGGEAYSGLAMAMEDFVDQIVQRDWDNAIRRKLQEFLQGNEMVLLDVFPALHSVLSKEDNSNQNSDKEDEDPKRQILVGKQDDQELQDSNNNLDDKINTDNTAHNNRKEESKEHRSKRRVFFFQQLFHAVLSVKSSPDPNPDKKHNNNERKEQQPEQRASSSSLVNGLATSQPQEPPCIVMVLDDLQWADKASLDLISSLVRDPDLGSFLLIATSRSIPKDDDSYHDHLFIKQLDCWNSERVYIETLTLENLDISSIDNIVAACLGQDSPDHDGELKVVVENNLDINGADENSTFPLAQIIHQRTRGNAFFAIEFLKALVDHKVLTFSYGTLRWKWDIDQVHSLGMTMTDSPVDLLISKVKRLPPNQQLILLIASCLGGTFKAPLIRKVIQSIQSSSNDNSDNKMAVMSLATTTHSNEPVLETLESFVQSGLLDRSGKSFFFVHDLIRQSTREFVSIEEMEWTKLCIGETILRGLRSNKSKHENNLFLGVDLCNSAWHLIIKDGKSEDGATSSNNNTEQAYNSLDLLGLARFNLRAGEKAMTNSSFNLAVRYMTTGRHVLQKWQSGANHTNNMHEEELAANLLAGATEASYCSGNYDDMNAYAEELLGKSDCPEDLRLRMLYFKVQSATAQEFASEALDVGYKAVEMLGFATFPRHPKPHQIIIEVLKTKKALRNHTMQSLQKLPIAADNRRIAAMEFLNAMKGPGGACDPNFLVVTFMKSVRWSLKYGLGKHSPSVFVVYGSIMSAMFGDLEAPKFFGELALALADRMGIQETTAETSALAYGMIRHSTDDMRSCYAPLVFAQQLAIECGDIETVTFCLIFENFIMWCAAMVSLPELGKHLQKHCAICRDFKHRSMLEVLGDMAIRLRRLCGQEESGFRWLDNPDESPSEIASNAEAMPAKAESKDTTMLAFYDVMALQSHLLLDERQEALACAKRTLNVGVSQAVGQIFVPRAHLYRGLVFLTPGSDGQKVKRKHLQDANHSLSLLKKWADSGNKNCVHMVTLLEAEFARVRKQNEKAIELYGIAIRAAESSNLTHDVAISHERAAVFFLECEQNKKKAAYHVENSIRGFRTWGASAVVRRLEQSYCKLLEEERDASKS